MSVTHIPEEQMTRLQLILAWVRLGLYVALVTTTIVVGATQAYALALDMEVPRWTIGTLAVLGYIGGLAGGAATANFTWLKPGGAHRELRRQ